LSAIHCFGWHAVILLNCCLYCITWLHASADGPLCYILFAFSRFT
jgi:hypothetical protein